MASVEKRPGYTLNLNEREAKVLHAVLHKVGGDPEKSYRRETQRIADLLNEALGDNASASDSGLNPDLFDLSDGHIHMDPIK
jgi:hypothetical protein